MAQRISPSVFDKVDTFIIAELFVGKLEELIPQLKIFAETFSVYFFTEVSIGYLLYVYLNFYLLMMNSKIQKAEDGKNAGSAKKSVQTGKKVADKKEANTS